MNYGLVSGGRISQLPTETLAAVEALADWKQLLHERPLVNSLKTCRGMAAAARKVGQVLATGFNHLHFEAATHINRTLDHGLSQFRSSLKYDGEVLAQAIFCSSELEPPIQIETP